MCDGYDGNGMFHINWGWNGMSNGYFLLSVLDPDTQGIGSATGSYGYIRVAAMVSSTFLMSFSLSMVGSLPSSPLALAV